MLHMAAMPATLPVTHRTASIARTTALITVAEGNNLFLHKTSKFEADQMIRYHDDRDYDSDDDSRYRRRSTRFD